MFSMLCENLHPPARTDHWPNLISSSWAQSHQLPECLAFSSRMWQGNLFVRLPRTGTPHQQAPHQIGGVSCCFVTECLGLPTRWVKRKLPASKQNTLDSRLAKSSLASLISLPINNPLQFHLRLASTDDGGGQTSKQQAYVRHGH